jgi:hypothetical protein
MTFSHEDLMTLLTLVFALLGLAYKFLRLDITRKSRIKFFLSAFCKVSYLKIGYRYTKPSKLLAHTKRIFKQNQNSTLANDTKILELNNTVITVNEIK